MAIWTAQRDGTWSTDASNVLSPWNGYGNPASGIPASGDTVNISNKTVTFDVDQSGFASGLAALTFAGGTLQASTSAGSYYLKMAGNIIASAGSSYIKAGSSGTAYPSNCVFTIYLNGNYQINCNSSNYLTLELYCYEPVVKYAQLISATSKAITSITLGSTTTIGCTGHGYSVGNAIYLANVGGTTELSNKFWEVATVPDANSFTIRWPQSDVAVDSTNYTAYTSGGSVCPQQAEASSATQIEIDQDVSADPEWARSGAAVRIDNINKNLQSESYTISEVTSTYLTTSALSSAKLSGSKAILTTRNVRITTSGTAISNGIIRYGTGHVLRCQITSSNTGNNGIQEAINSILSGVYSGGTASGAAVNLGSGHTVSGVITGWSFGLLSSSSNAISGLVSGCTTGLSKETSDVVSGIVSGCSTGIGGSSVGISLSGSVDGCSNGCSSNSGMVIAGTFDNCGIGINVGDGFYITGIIRNCVTGMASGAGHLLNAVQILGCTSGVGSGVYTFIDCVIKANTYDLNTTTSFYAISTTFGSVTVFNNYSGAARAINAYANSVNHNNIAGAFLAWTCGGIVTKQATTYPTDYTYSYDHALESATAYCFWQQQVTVPAGGGLVVECLIRKDASMSYLPRLWLLLPGIEPLISGSPSYAAIMTNSVDTWETLLLVYANATSADVQITVRTIGQNATGHVYALPIVTVLAPATYDVYSTLQADITTILDRTPVLVGGRVDANVGSISGDTTAADNAESFFDGTGYDGTNNTIPTVTTVNGFATDSLTAAALSAGAVSEIQAGLSTLTAAQVWEYGTRTLSSFGTLVSDIATGLTTGTYQGRAYRDIWLDVWKQVVGNFVADDADEPTTITYQSPDESTELIHTITDTTRDWSE